MEQKPLSEFTDDELAKEAKDRKKQYYLSATIFGFMVGVAAFSTYRNGFGFFTFFPLFFLPMTTSSTKKFKDVKAEMDLRGLKA